MITLCLTEHERRAVLSGLRRLRSSILGLQRRNKANGWNPRPGFTDIQELRLATVEGLLARYGGDDTPQLQREKESA